MEQNNNLEEMRKEYFNAVYHSKALLIKETPFDLKSGGKSRVYLSHNHFLSKSRHIRLVAEIYLKLLQGKCDSFKLCVVDSVMSPVITGVMTSLSGKDVVVVKQTKTEHGTKEDVYGEISGEIVLIDDMTSTGGTLTDAAKKIREKGGVVNLAVVSACRNDVAKNNLEKEGIELLSIASFQEILSGLKDRLTEKEKAFAGEEFTGFQEIPS